MTALVRLHRRVMARLADPSYWADAAGWFTAAAFVQLLMGVDVAGLAVSSWLVAIGLAVWRSLTRSKREGREP